MISIYSKSFKKNKNNSSVPSHKKTTKNFATDPKKNKSRIVIS